VSEATTANGDPDSLDSIASDLLALKEANPVSYAEIGRRIGQRRIDRGIPSAAAYPPRSTIYDAFRTGRTWIDSALLRDIVHALGVSDEEAEQWVERSQRLRRNGEPVARQRVTPTQPPATAPSLPPFIQFPTTRTPPWWSPYALILGCIALNLLGIVVVQALHLPIYLDMAGTASVAMILGPWPGAFVALASNLLGFSVGAPGAAPFALVNLAGALVWGYGVKGFHMGDDIGRFFLLNLLAATACSLVGAPLNVILFGGLSGHGSDTVVESIVHMGVPMIASAFSANILTSVIDKHLTGFIALMVFVWLHRTAHFSASRMLLVERLSAPATSVQVTRRREPA
jgi:energy-coupling factor transport system substrate-specific component